MFKVWILFYGERRKAFREGFNVAKKNFPKANRSSASVKHDNTESMKETILGRLLDSRL